MTEVQSVEQIIKDLIALTEKRLNWQGFPHYQETIEPIEDEIDQKLSDLDLPLVVDWDREAKRYGLFPRDAQKS